MILVYSFSAQRTRTTDDVPPEIADLPFEQASTSICISGPHVEDTSVMLRKVLALWPIRVAFVRVSEVFWSRNQFFERILVQLRQSAAHVASASHLPNYVEGHTYIPEQRQTYKNTDRCGTAATFIEALKDIFLQSNSLSSGRERAYILLEEVNKLDYKVFGSKIIPLLLRLQELVRDLHFSSISVLTPSPFPSLLSQSRECLTLQSKSRK